MIRTDERWTKPAHSSEPRSSLLLVLILSAMAVGCEQRGEDAAMDDLDLAPAVFEEPAPVRPATVGLDSAMLASTYAFAAELPRLRCLLVARHGEILGEQCFRGPGPGEFANIKSVSKSVLSAVVGIAIAEGHLDGPDQQIFPFFNQYLAADPEDGRRQITIGNLLSMQSGLERTSGTNYGSWVQSANWVRYALTRPLVAAPGTTRLYSTGNSHLLSAILTEATGQTTWDYARAKLADPLGIRLPRWPADPQGIYFGGNEMRMTPRDMVRFGELYRNMGELEGRQIVPREWIEASLSSVTRSWSARETYGYGWFMGSARGHNYFYAQGYGGQFIFVVPGLELTVVTTSHPEDPRTAGHNQAIQRIFRDMLIPAAELGAFLRPDEG